MKSKGSSVLEILDETSRYPRPSRQALAAALERLLERFGASDKEVTVVLVGDDTMRRLNLEYRGVDEATDVLSYPLHEPSDVGFPQIPHLGDIVVNLDLAVREAAQDLDAEVKVLAAHGLMHLLGYDHDTEAAWNVFKTAQKLVLTPASHQGET